MAKRNADSAESAASEHRWSQIIDSLEEGVVGIDRDGRVVSMNQAAEQLTACSVGAARGRHHTKIFEQSRWVSELIEEAGGRDRRSVSAEGSLRGLWEKEMPVRASASGIFDADAQRAGTALILQDLSLQRNLETDVRRAESLADLGTLVAGLAHEIRNPLGGIRGAVQLLGAEIGPHPAHEYVDLVLREVDRLSKLLGQLLELSPRGGGTPQAVNIHRVIDHVLAIVDATAREERVRVLRIFDPSLPDVRGDPDALTQLVLNLLQNALQAVSSSPAGEREVRITTRLETDYHLTPQGSRDRGRTRLLRVDIEDNGPGVPREVAANLFSPFVTTKAKGTGLGLTICQRIASDHGGSVRVESVPGRTLFRVMLPAWDKEPAPS